MTARIVNSVQLEALINEDPAFVGNKKYIDPQGFHVLSSTVAGIDDQPTVRCLLDIKIIGQEAPAQARIDVSLKNFLALPTYEDWKATHSDD